MALAEMNQRASHESGLPQESLNKFKQDLTTPVSQERIEFLTAFYSDEYKRHKEEIEKDPERFIPTGETPLTTPYDALREGYQWLPEELVVKGMVEGHLDMEILLHPSRIEALKEMEKGEFTPSHGKDIPVLESFIADNTAVHSSDFSFRSISEREARSQGLDAESSARKILCEGLWNWTSNDMVTSPIFTNSTPDNLSAPGLATIAALQGRAYVPMDGIWNDVKNQKIMFLRAVALLEQNPVLANHPDKDYLLTRAKKLLGVTLKAHPDETLEKMEYLYEEAGVRSYRIYDPRQRSFLLEETVKRARNRFIDINLLAGNLMDVEDERRLADVGSNAVTGVLFAGGICTTPDKARVAPENIRIAYEFARAKLPIPLIIDSGTGDTYIILIAAGASGFMKGQTILSGLEKPPYLQWQSLENGHFGSNFSGEAGKRTKLLGGKVDRLGRPLFVEGEDNYVVYDPEKPTAPTCLYHLFQDLATGVIFAKGKNLESVRLNPNPSLLYMTSTTESIASGHHNPTNRNSFK